jgi:hypothetical protein
VSDYAPKYQPGEDATYQCSAAVVGGNVLVLTAAGQVAPSAAAAAAIVGVAEMDAVTGDYIAASRGGVQRCVSAAAIAVGGGLMAAAAGRVTPFTGTDYSLYIGTALTAAGAAGVTVDVQWEK